MRDEYTMATMTTIITADKLRGETSANMLKLGLMLAALALLLLPPAAGGSVEFFSMDGCGPCDAALDYLTELRGEYNFTILFYNDSSLNGSDFDYYNKTATRLGISDRLRVVPMIVSGDDYHLGFKEGDEDILLTLISKVSKEPDYPPDDDSAGVGGDSTPAGNYSGEHGNNTALLELFWAEGCPHCAAEERWLDSLDYPGLEIRRYEIAYNDSNRELLKERAGELGFEPSGVPVTIIGDWVHIGYGDYDDSGCRIEGEIYRALGMGEKDFCSRSEFVVEIPGLGTLDLSEMGIPLSTVVIGLMDGFNPCAFFVLTMLLSFLIYAGSRKRMLLIGLTFVFISGLVYFMFMTAIFGVIRAVNEIRLLALIGGVIALSMAAINLKDFFFFKKGISLTIPDDKKPRLYKRMRRLIKAESMVALLAGTVVLAFVANSYELLCTAGLPLVYGNLLNSQQLDAVSSLFYIGLYNVFYVLPLLAIVLAFVRGVGGGKLSREKGETLKAISGFMMLGFGVFLIIDPLVLRNIFVTGGLIVFAVVLSILLARLKAYLMRRHSAEGGKSEEKSEEEMDGDEKPGKDESKSDKSKNNARKNNKKEKNATKT